MDHGEHTPTVGGRRLARELRRLREAAGLTLEQVSDRLNCSRSKLYRIENGRSRARGDDLEDMLDLYGVEPRQREELLRLGRDARRNRGWWAAYNDVLTGAYIALESEAARIRVNARLVPDFLQTEGYARALLAAARPSLDAEEVERHVTARIIRRTELFERTPPPELHVICDEAALRRRVGGAEVMAAQLAELVAVARRPGVTVRILPFEAGAHAGVDGAFTLLDFADPDDRPIAYVDGPAGDIMVEAEDRLKAFDLTWDHLLAEALSPEESMALLNDR